MPGDRFLSYFRDFLNLHPLLQQLGVINECLSKRVFHPKACLISFPLLLTWSYPHVCARLAQSHPKSWLVIAQTQESDHTFSAVSTMSMMV